MAKKEHIENPGTLDQLMDAAPVAEKYEERLARFEKILGDLITSPESRTTVLHAFRRLDVPSGFAANLAREAIHKLPSQQRDYVEETEFNRFHSPHEQLLRWIVWAFVAVLVGSVVPLAVIAIMRASPGASASVRQGEATSNSSQQFTIAPAAVPDTSTAQILLTVFTTTAGFLAGLLSPNPMEQRRFSALSERLPTIREDSIATTKGSS
ncbi:MAG: hypothetical protein SFV81_00655 [Pirellulaceae bacterium]|nr:hypothetical protein [Pirellulaceae bacterium]